MNRRDFAAMFVGLSAVRAIEMRRDAERAESSPTAPDVDGVRAVAKETAVLACNMKQARAEFDALLMSAEKAKRAEELSEIRRALRRLRILSRA